MPLHEASVKTGPNCRSSFNFSDMRNYTQIKFAVILLLEDAGWYICWHIATNESTAFRHHIGGSSRLRTTSCWGIRPWVVRLAGQVNQWMWAEIIPHFSKATPLLGDVVSC